MHKFSCCTPAQIVVMSSYYMRMNFRRLHASICQLFLTTSTRSMADAFREVQTAPNVQVPAAVHAINALMSCL